MSSLHEKLYTYIMVCVSLTDKQKLCKESKHNIIVLPELIQNSNLASWTRSGSECKLC